MEFEEQMIKYEMIDLESKGYVAFSKKRLLSIFGGQRFASQSKKRLLTYLPDRWSEGDVKVMEHEDVILVLSATSTRDGKEWVGTGKDSA